jgi:hypothetical protein
MFQPLVQSLVGKIEKEAHLGMGNTLEDPVVKLIRPWMADCEPLKQIMEKNVSLYTAKDIISQSAFIAPLSFAKRVQDIASILNVAKVVQQGMACCLIVSVTNTQN